MLRFVLVLFSLSVLLFLPACAKRSRSTSLSASDQRSAHPQIENVNAPQTPVRININTASAKELEILPGIGEGLAQRIIEHREKYGPFRLPEHLLLVRGISDKRFRALRELITVE